MLKGTDIRFVFCGTLEFGIEDEGNYWLRDFGLNIDDEMTVISVERIVTIFLWRFT